MESHQVYQNPLITRYASKEMLENFSDDKKFRTWRRLWIALAEAQKELGLNITQEQIDEMKAYQNCINYDVAQRKEKEVRHDVMAHVHAYGEQCPQAKPIIHLGATSCYVTDNTDILIMMDGLKIIKSKLLTCMHYLSEFALKYKDMPTLGYTHFQPAQLTTVGKRACLWLQDLMLDMEEWEQVWSSIRLRGVKGTTGTQASFLTLFEGDHEKVKLLEKKVLEKMGFDRAYPVTGQTYPRKLDSRILNLLSSIAQSAYKFGNDLRLLQSLKELEEPFGEKQIGSSAMAYKRNPMKAERMCSLARYVMINALNAPMTASTQWLERTLDDSANRRIVIAECFLAVDAILNIYINIVSGLVVYPKVIEKRIMEELPFMATEYILMEAVKRGGDRQELHEKIRQYSMEAAKRVKAFGEDNNLLELIANDPAFKLSREEIQHIMDPHNFVGRAPQQVEEFISEYITPILERNKELIRGKVEVEV
ncbi:adenylosuccinate lyase [Caldicoprobacter guelmensis]|uniref:adenylosuccinate lyase n=1 Tax=Caldicoprobacter guelmensis TaxID=1170224 RepID=UPI00195D4320|nr:adenylosuccinate lyase [Caldicoprobacter guelmensis]MBM7581454.1 adenylosuccinate lyase [Caldicoprobacter guelmensis]